VGCCGRKGLPWELSRERDREKKDVGDIVFRLVFILSAYGRMCSDKLKSGSVHLAMGKVM